MYKDFMQYSAHLIFHVGAFGCSLFLTVQCSDEVITSTKLSRTAVNAVQKLIIITFTNLPIKSL